MVYFDRNDRYWSLSEEEYDLLNPPELEIIFVENVMYDRYLESPDWLPVGYIPTPKTKTAWFFYHFIHGLWMKYPVWKVILFCLDKDNYPVYERK